MMLGMSNRIFIETEAQYESGCAYVSSHQRRATKARSERAVRMNELIRRTYRHGEMCPCDACKELRSL